jgi:hypothetical protein
MTLSQISLQTTKQQALLYNTRPINASFKTFPRVRHIQPKFTCLRPASHSLPCTVLLHSVLRIAPSHLWKKRQNVNTAQSKSNWTEILIHFFYEKPSEPIARREAKRQLLLYIHNLGVQWARTRIGCDRGVQGDWL